jgi:hypothetical protein
VGIVLNSVFFIVGGTDIFLRNKARHQSGRMERFEALEPRISQRIKAADPKSLVEKSSSGNREIVGIRFLIFSQKQFDTQVKKSRPRSVDSGTCFTEGQARGT